jgi:glucose/arabinose dehydrogenase
LFILQQSGQIRVVTNGALLAAPFLDLSEQVSCCDERGLLGLAFHPDYERNGRFFVNYTDRAGDSVIARYTVSSDPDRADPASERVLLTIEQPLSNHKGGQLAFAPDGTLFVGLGDGGGVGDPFELAQDDGSLLGKLLRIDVDVDEPPYGRVPADNPRADRGWPLGLIWAKGLRNPWRFSFDRSSGDLYIGDVGQYRFEEIDVQPADSRGGENYGWDIFEGRACYEPAPAPVCPDQLPPAFTPPVLEYDHGEGCSVTGGFVYRGCALPDLRGAYFFSDFCTGFLRSFRFVDGAVTELTDWTAALAPGGGRTIDHVTSFGEDARGELYIAELEGEVYKIVPAN